MNKLCDFKVLVNNYHQKEKGMRKIIIFITIFMPVLFLSGNSIASTTIPSVIVAFSDVPNHTPTIQICQTAQAMQHMLTCLPIHNESQTQTISLSIPSYGITNTMIAPGETLVVGTQVNIHQSVKMTIRANVDEINPPDHTPLPRSADIGIVAKNVKGSLIFHRWLA